MVFAGVASAAVANRRAVGASGISAADRAGAILNADACAAEGTFVALANRAIGVAVFQHVAVHIERAAAAVANAVAKTLLFAVPLTRCAMPVKAAVVVIARLVVLAIEAKSVGAGGVAFAVVVGAALDAAIVLAEKGTFAVFFALDAALVVVFCGVEAIGAISVFASAGGFILAVGIEAARAAVAGIVEVGVGGVLIDDAGVEGLRVDAMEVAANLALVAVGGFQAG